MKHLQESILDKDYTGPDVGVVKICDISYKRPCLMKDMPASMFFKPEFDSFNVPGFLEFVLPEKVKIPVNLLKRKHGQYSLWKFFNKVEQEEIKKRALEYVKKHLNSVGKELFKQNPVTVLLGLMEIWPGDKRHHNTITIRVNTWDFIVFIINMPNVEDIKNQTQAPS